MTLISLTPKPLLLLLLAGTASAGLAAQAPILPPSEQEVTVTGTAMAKGPKVEGIISARTADRIKIVAPDGTSTIVAVDANTRIRSSGGFLGANRDKLTAASLFNGLPVTVQTVQGNDSLVASRIDLKSKDLRTAAMIRHGTDQRFDEQTAATEALRSHVADIGDYNVKGTTNVNFATGKAVLSEQAKQDLCAAAAQAQATKNALILVIGYTDSTGSQEYNQQLSEKRAAAVTNHLQQACGWKPYRMLSPTGMAEAEPAASNDTVEGKAQNRRVAVNILVSKGLDGMQ